ncbi:hypothetical protein [Intestinimonas butyriciproducens]|uniref:hypothetical protein n=1 Tax=Intestinimonas butyriciproducens TaxID=1297617 RepID=UPI001958C353|nr:hypothetical protein [Intestinimonas butyriciproducens]MBM6918650.1 hypothetical protein [Intestinimonas butyriciproducens]
MNHKKSITRLFALGLSAVMLLGLFGCNKQEEASKAEQEETEQAENPTDAPEQQDKEETPLPDVTGPLNEEEYLIVCQQYYDELMLASNEASLKLEEAMSATAETEEEKKSQQNKIDVAMGLISNMRPMYERFAELQAPESYAEAHELVKTGATASSEVLRLTVEIAEAAKGENGAAEALVLQAEMEEYTSDAQNFSKGLQMVLGDVVGTGTDMD